MAESCIIVITGVCATINRSHGTHRLVGNEKTLGFARHKRVGPKCLGRTWQPRAQQPLPPPVPRFRLLFRKQRLLLRRQEGRTSRGVFGVGGSAQLLQQEWLCGGGSEGEPMGQHQGVCVCVCVLWEVGRPPQDSQPPEDRCRTRQGGSAR